MPSLTDTLRGAAPGSVDEAAIISQLDAASCGAVSVGAHETVLLRLTPKKKKKEEEEAVAVEEA